MRGIDDETLCASVRNECRSAVHLDVAQCSAFHTNEVMVIAGVRVEPRGARAEIKYQEFTHLGEIVERLVHGTQGDAGHLLRRNGVQRLC